jgi:alpha-beta hydrolase superfamily lysophospholipase
MSRSYHVTKKASIVAFVNDDTEPTYQASEKAWVKSKQKQARAIKKAVPEKAVATARAIVAKEKRRTASVRSSREGIQ